MDKDEYQKMMDICIPKESPIDDFPGVVVPAGQEIEDRYRLLLKRIEEVK